MPENREKGLNMGRMKYFQDCDVVVTEKENPVTEALPYPINTDVKLSQAEIEQLVDKYIEDQDVVADFVMKVDVYENKGMSPGQRSNAVALWLGSRFVKAGYNKSVAMSLGQRVTHRLFELMRDVNSQQFQEKQDPVIVDPPEVVENPDPEQKVEIEEVYPIGSDKLFCKKIMDLTGEAYKIYACMTAKASVQKEFTFPVDEYTRLGLGSNYSYKRAIRELCNSGLILCDSVGVPTDKTKFSLAEVKEVPQLRIEPEKLALSEKIRIENVLIEANRIMDLIEMMDMHYAANISKVADKRTEEFYSVFAIMKKRYEDFDTEFRQIVYG